MPMKHIETKISETSIRMRHANEPRPEAATEWLKCLGSPAAVEQFGEPSRQRQGHAARSASTASTPKFSCIRADRASM